MSDQNNLSAFTQAMEGAKGGMPELKSGMPELNSNSAIPDDGSDSNKDNYKFDGSDQSTQNLLEQQRQQREIARNHRRSKLYGEINPLHDHRVFDAQQQKVKQELESARLEVRQMALQKGVIVAHPEVEQTVFGETVEPKEGTGGKGVIHHIKQMVQLHIRQKESAAWASVYTQKTQNRLTKGQSETKKAHDDAHHEVALTKLGA